MKTKNKNRLDLKKRVASVNSTEENILSKDIILKVIIPSTYNRKNSPCYKVIRLTSEQVTFYIGSTDVPPKFQRKRSRWTQLSQKQRLQWHFAQIAEDYSYFWEYGEA